MNQTGDVFNRKHMQNIRQKVEQGTGAALGRHAPRSAAARAGIVFMVLAACVLFGTSALSAFCSIAGVMLTSVVMNPSMVAIFG